MPLRCPYCRQARTRDQVYPLMFGELVCFACGTWVEGRGCIEWPSPWELEMQRVPRVEWRYNDPVNADPEPDAGGFFDKGSGIEVMPQELARAYNTLADEVETLRAAMKAVAPKDPESGA